MNAGTESNERASGLHFACAGRFTSGYSYERCKSGFFFTVRKLEWPFFSVRFLFRKFRHVHREKAKQRGPDTFVSFSVARPSERSGGRKRFAVGQEGGGWSFTMIQVCNRIVRNEERSNEKRGLANQRRQREKSCPGPKKKRKFFFQFQNPVFSILFLTSKPRSISPLPYTGERVSDELNFFFLHTEMLPPY